MSRSTQKIQINIQDIKDNYLEIYNKYTTLKHVGGGRYLGLCSMHSEKSPSFNVFDGGGYKCFGCGIGGGDVIDFIQKKEGLSFVESLEFCSKNIGISPSKTKIKRIPIIKEAPLIEFNICKFEQKHKDYWNKYLLPESYLNKENVFAVRKLAYNKKIQDIGDEAVFVYIAEDINKPKILRIGPNVTKKTKWRTTVPFNYLWSFPKEHVNTLFITKSYKDRLVLNHHFGLTCTAPQSEEGVSLLQYNYDRLEAIADNKVVVYGSDFQGWHESLLITEYTGWDYLNTENYMEKYGVNDPASLVEHFGLNCLKKLLINKKYLT